MPENILANVLAILPAFFREEADLFGYDVNERSLTHKLAEHLQPRFPGYHVDCEYNRRGYEQKKLPNPEPTDSGNLTGKTIYPDIVVHQRGQQDNLLVIEVKKVGNDDRANDIAKLRQLTEAHGGYAYICGLYLIIDCQHGRLAEAMIYMQGKPSDALTKWFNNQVAAAL